MRPLFPPSVTVLLRRHQNYIVCSGDLMKNRDTITQVRAASSRIASVAVSVGDVYLFVNTFSSSVTIFVLV